MSIGLDRLLAIKDNPNPMLSLCKLCSLKMLCRIFSLYITSHYLMNQLNLICGWAIAPVVAPHYDINDNLACVAAGSRKFTLFPPDQINNLYLGPTLNTPAGVPISLVDIRDPDLKRFPKYTQALDAGFEATLNAGDAIFIPALWWHGVESLETLNILVNYWWGDEPRK